jgi:uncharacterized protein (TIGR02996 family)
VDELATLLRAVLVSPDEDTPRLMLADEWEDRGEGERAEFVRWQCRQAIRHPFPRVSWRKWFNPWWTGATCRSTLHRGGPCLILMKVRKGAEPPRQMYVTRGFASEFRMPLSDFHSPLGIHALTRELFAAHPVTRVTLTDREPLEWTEDAGSASHDGDRWFSWLDRKQPGESVYRVPGELIDAMVRAGARRNHRKCAVRFTTRELALAALSDACVSLGRKLVGLPPLKENARA